MGVVGFHDLKTHLGHKVKCVVYGDLSDPCNAAIECETCGEVLFDYDKPEPESQLETAVGILLEILDMRFSQWESGDQDTILQKAADDVKCALQGVEPEEELAVCPVCDGESYDQDLVSCSKCGDLVHDCCAVEMGERTICKTCISNTIKPPCHFCGLESKYIAAQSEDEGKTIEWVAVCQNHAEDWSEDQGWLAPMYPIDLETPMYEY